MKIIRYIIKVKNIFKNKYDCRKLDYCGKHVKIWKGVVIHGRQSVRIGNNTGIGDYVVIWGGGGVEIGNDVLIAAHSIITSQGHDLNAELFDKSNIMKKIVIKDNVWIGAGTIILPGVTIEENSVIGAGSVVTHNIPANSIALGTPAKVIKNRQF